MRARFSTYALVALSALLTGALGIAVTLAAIDSAGWPDWLRPYNRWGWWAVLALLVAAAILAVWEYAHQTKNSPPASSTISVQAHDSGLVAGRDATIAGGQGIAAGRDAQAIAGGLGQTAGRDIINITAVPKPPEAPIPTVLDQLPATRPGPLVANLPPRNPSFTGREDLLDRLHATLQPGQPAAVVQVQVQALHGLGGVGKTQLALEYAYRHERDYDLVWWLSAEEPTAIPGQLVAFSRRLGLPEAAKQAETIQALWDALRRRDRWLLVFDNAEDSRDLWAWWPPGSGHVLITSRTPTWTGLAATLAVDVLSRAEAVLFLQRRLNAADPKFADLAEALGDLPLALEQAAAYLEETDTSASGYIALLGDRSRELFTLGRPATTEQTVATTWTVAIHRLRGHTPMAEELLTFCAFLAADDIPRALPSDYSDMLPDPLGATVRDQLAYPQTVSALRALGLVKTSGDALSMHRLVQAVVRHQLDLNEQRQWATVALRLIHAAFPMDHNNPDASPTYDRLLPHALAVTGHAQALDVEPQITAFLLHRAGLYLWKRADHQQARSLFERALELHEACTGPDDPDTAVILSNLANVMYAQGDLDGARARYERALAIYEARLGLDHPYAGHSLSNLAQVLRSQGDLEGARTLLERALASIETHMGSDHPNTAAMLQNVADVLFDQGDLEGARTRHERALAIREARLGASHPDTADSLRSVASVLAVQGDLNSARALLERALTIREDRQADHPDTAVVLFNLALVQAAQGDLDAARTLHERALAIRETRLGADHPDTAASLSGLANVLYATGNPDSARNLHARALAIRETRLGADHPDTARSREALAAVVAALGNDS